MTGKTFHRHLNNAVTVLAIAACLVAVPPDAAAQTCPGTTVVSGLRVPLGLTATNLENLLVAESGTAAIHSGRISIIGHDGVRRTLIDGLPSGPNDIGEPSGPAGVVMRGRTLYVLIGTGDSVLPAPIPTRHLPNPNVSSPIFSSVLAIHFAANVERTTSGFVLSTADQQTLAAGGRVVLSNGGGDTIDIELIANFPDYIPAPFGGNPNIVRASNPFDVAIHANQLFVTDGSRNLVWEVDIPSGSFTPLATFPNIPNPIPGFAPELEAVPTGIEYVDGQLLVALFRGVPFPPGTSTIVQIDPATGTQAPLISGLKTAIGVAKTDIFGGDDYLVLQHSSGGLFFGGPGLVLGFDPPTTAAQTLANCLTRPSAMWLDETTGILYATELVSGRLVALPLR